tara:strand:- start:100 stop:408 length:309 start_codon:yes stop_codon:yes gene_type:complete
MTKSNQSKRFVIARYTPSSGDNTLLFEFECAQHLTDRDKTNYINWFLRPYGLNASEVITDTSYDECEALHQEQGIEWYFCSWHFYKQLKQSAEFHELVLQEN